MSLSKTWDCAVVTASLEASPFNRLEGLALAEDAKALRTSIKVKSPKRVASSPVASLASPRSNLIFVRGSSQS
jgi:hypothetical protein